MSVSTPVKRIPTNISPADVIMDQRGVKDARYYCLPPFHGSVSGKKRRQGSGYAYHLVFQGHTVGVFDSWPEAKSSLTGYPDSGNQGFDSMDGCIEAWQGLCTLGVHPHPVDPAFVTLPTPSTSAFVNTTPRKSASSRQGPSSASIKAESTQPRASIKREATPVHGSSDRTQILADLKRYCSPLPPQSKREAVPTAPASSNSRVPVLNFAIRGGGIVSSSAQRSQQRYLDMQERGEEPDMLVTRSLEQASLFALDDEDEDEDGSRLN